MNNICDKVKDFPKRVKEVFDSLYRAGGAQTYDEKILLLSRNYEGTPPKCITRSETLKMLEFEFATKLGLLEDRKTVPLRPISKEESRSLISLGRSVHEAPKTKAVYLGGENLRRKRKY